MDFTQNDEIQTESAPAAFFRKLTAVNIHFQNLFIENKKK